ncbi:cytochrome P450 [Biscogniauxia marginata]|nr:cytochrome P450 [Biscogniauxia marginata]
MLPCVMDLQGWLLSGPSEQGYEPLYWLRQVIGLLAIGYATWGVCVGLYRVTLHPLAKIPGPKLAAMSYWYDIYYEIILGGQYFKRIKDMHREYGPIIRINPDEVHFNDPDFIDTLYPTTGRKTDKPHVVGYRTGTPNSIVATIDHHKHRMRRNSINAFFSIASIRRVEPSIKEKLERMLGRWHKLAGRDGKVLNMHTVFKAYASDVITTYAFGDCFHFLDDEDWGAEYFSSTDKYFKLTHVFGHFPMVMRLVNSTPTWVLSLFIPSLSAMSEKQSWWINRVRKIRKSPDPNEIKSTIFEGILSSTLPDSEKTDARMANDAQLIGLAGEGTTAYTLSATLFELLSHPEDYKKARDEIISVMPNSDTVPSYAEVENLVYFNAVIQESLRLHPGVMSRMPRISPDEDIIYRDETRDTTYILPAGTPASMTTFITHMDPEIFEAPHEFRPQRWLDNPKIGRSFIAFSRGSRNCIGQNFARREMGMILATLLSRYEIYHGQEGRTLELYDTIRERDIVANSEMIIPMPARGSHGLRVRIRT